MPSEINIELIKAQQIRSAVERVLEGWTLPFDARKILETALYAEPEGWKCSKCGVDRLRVPCPNGTGAVLTGECPMKAIAQ